MPRTRSSAHRHVAQAAPSTTSVLRTQSKNKRVAHTHAADATIQTRRAGCKPDQARVLRLVLVNPHQICYANAVLLAWLWLTVSDSGDFRDFAGALSLAMTSLPEARPPVYFPALQVWKQRRWQRPTIQHDAHEFGGYLATQALAPAFRGRWEARTLLPGQPRVVDSSLLAADRKPPIYRLLGLCRLRVPVAVHHKTFLPRL